MKLTSALLISLALLAATVSLRPRRDAALSPGIVEIPNGVIAFGRTSPIDSSATPRSADRVQRSKDAVAYNEYQRRLTLGDEISAFVADRNGQTAAARQERATALLAEIEALDTQGYLPPAQRAFLDATIHDALDPQSNAAARRALLEKFSPRAAQDVDAFANDSRFQELKARERAIVEKALNTRHFPSGMTREEFVAKELSNLSIEIYGDAPVDVE